MYSSSREDRRNKSDERDSLPCVTGKRHVIILAAAIIKVNGDDPRFVSALILN